MLRKLRLSYLCISRTLIGKKKHLSIVSTQFSGTSVFLSENVAYYMSISLLNFDFFLIMLELPISP